MTRGEKIRNAIIGVLAVVIAIMGIFLYRANNPRITNASAGAITLPPVPSVNLPDPIPPSKLQTESIVPEKPAQTVSTLTDNQEIRTLRDVNMKNIPATCVDCDGRCYGIQKGDTLSRIAIRFYGTTRAIPELMRINNISDQNKIFAESCICLPKNIKLAPAPPKPASKPRVAASKPKPIAPVKLSEPVKPVEPPPVIQVCPPCPECQTCQQPIVPVPLVSPETPRPEAKREFISPVVIPVIDTKIPDIRQKVGVPFIMPGSLSNTTGNILPAEKGNIISETRVEQGATVFRKGSFSVLPFVQMDTTIDTKGYDWNNKILTRGGVKAVKTFDAGIIEGNINYTEERRMRSASKESQVGAEASYWFGWHQPTGEDAGWFSSYPGSSWGIVGEVSPFEKDNTFGAVYTQQGVNMHRIGRSLLIPYGEYLYTIDEKGYDWNNRNLYGGGLKLAVPLREGMVVDFGAAYKKEERRKTGATYEGVTGAVNFWMGWNPPLGDRR